MQHESGLDVICYLIFKITSDTLKMNFESGALNLLPATCKFNSMQRRKRCFIIGKKTKLRIQSFLAF